ncbi:MAG: hypothetical protein SFU56_01240 [Capsulimonadales bacterium]|nr:hypothetical protein [Capsulimonadales bacterium]
MVKHAGMNEDAVNPFRTLRQEGMPTMRQVVRGIAKSKVLLFELGKYLGMVHPELVCLFLEGVEAGKQGIIELETNCRQSDNIDYHYRRLTGGR